MSHTLSTQKGSRDYFSPNTLAVAIGAIVMTLMVL